MASTRTPKNGERCITYGFNFKWTPDHLTPEQMRPYMFSYDVLATEALDVLDQFSSSSSSTREEEQIASADPVQENISAAKQDRQSQTQGHRQQPPQLGNSDNNKLNPKQKRDLFALLQAHHHENETLSSLWTQLHTVPEWVDWAQISRGQNVFYRYALPFVISLTFQSLLGGMGSSRVSHTLSKTGGFSGKITRKRLLDTFQHVLDVTRDLESIKPGPDNKGFVSSVRVRLLHASVRRRILSLAKEDPSGGYYIVAENGIPINDLDSMATIIAFSATVIFLGFPRQGILLHRQEIEDYLALWRWVGYIMGTPVDVHFSSPEKAKALMESLGLYEIDPSETSAALANNIITGLQNQPPTFASKDFLRAQAYWLNGCELASALRVPKPSLWYFFLVGVQCLLFSVFAYIRRVVPYLDRRNIARMRVLLHREVMNQCRGVEASHGFKYLPRLGKETVQDGPPSLGEEEELFGAKAGRRRRKSFGFWDMDWSFSESSDKTANGIERLWVILFLGVSAAVGGVGLWFGRGLVGGCKVYLP